MKIAGRDARRYEVDYEDEGKKLVERIGFLLRGKTRVPVALPLRTGGKDGCLRAAARNVQLVSGRLTPFRELGTPLRG